MSQYSLSIIFLNLGGEMLYVLDQRLKAQQVPYEKSKKVLNEISAIMLNEKFLGELFKPQKIYSKQALYTLYHDIAHASIMKLNDDSMVKLYDLMLMVFKYQVTLAACPRDILSITLNHLDQLRQMVSSVDIIKQIDYAYFLLQKTHFKMNEYELQRIRYDILNFFQDVHIKVSIFLRQGQQNTDGIFVIPTEADIPAGVEIPGISRIYNWDGSLRTMLTFPSGGEYKTRKHTGSLELHGKRSTTLGTSIYKDNTLNDDGFWWAANIDGLSSEKWKKIDGNSAYRSEISTLMEQLLGSENDKSQEETFIQLDLFRDNFDNNRVFKESATPTKTSNVTMVTLDGSRRENSTMQKVLEEMDSNLAGNTEPQFPDILQLFESIDQQ